MDIKYSYYVSSKGFKTVGGTAAQFLKADGSVDNNSYVTTNTVQNITSIKSFISSGGNAIANHSLRAYSTDGSKAGIVLYTGGVGAGIMNYNTTGEFEFKTSDDLGYKSIRAAGFVRNGSDDNSFLTAGGSSVLRSAYSTVAQSDAKYIPLSQKAVANGVATLDATTQIPNAQIPQRMIHKVIALGGETADTSFTGLYDRNQLALADKEHIVTSIINGSGSFNGGMAAFNNTILNSKSDFATITGTDSTTEVIITIVFNSTLNHYGRGKWQPFIQTRLTAGQQFRNVVVEVMDSGNVWYSPAELSVQDMTLIPNSGLFLFPESYVVTSAVKAVRFKLSNVVTSNGIAYVSNIGFRHVSHSFAPQFPHRGENNKFFGINDFSLSPTVPTATLSNQAVNFGQITGKVNQSDLNTQLAGYATLAGVQTFTNTKTFLQSPIVPNATLLPHAVNFGQMSNAIEESEGNTIGYVSGNFQTLNTPQNVGATKSYTSPFPFKFKTAGTKTWVLHKPNGNTLIFAPSTTIDSEDWSWYNQISFYDDSTVEALKFRVRGGASNQIMMADGSTSTDFVTTNTAQSIRGYKTFEAGAELLLKGDDQNLIQSFKSSNNYGGHLVAGWYYRHYSAIWQTGIIRDAGDLSEGFGFDLSENGGSTFNRIFKIQADGNLVTNNFGSANEWKEAHDWGDHSQAGYLKLDNNGKISTKGIIHPDYPNDNNLAFMADGGIRDINDFGGTLVKYIEVQAGAAFTPSTDDEHLDLYARGDMELYLDSLVHTQGKKITVYTNNNLSTEVKVYRDGNLVRTIQSGRTTEFILTFTGWIMTDIGTSTFI